MKHLYTLLFIFSTIISTAQGPAQPFQNPKLPTETRIKDLISRLTLEEKTQMMLYNSPAIERLGIPEYNWWNECLHGVGRAGNATVFPQAIGMAATFNEDLIFEVSSAISDEARAKHNAAINKGNRRQYTGLTFWTPNINIFRDPRWGRGQETYGEDPFLTGKIGASFVKGLQGNDPKYLKAAACAKHYAVHNGPEKIRHHFNAVPSEKDFYEVYLPAFKELVDADVEAIMCAYNRTYDEPCCGSPFLLQNILRNEWGFDGHIVSDCWALDDIWLRHKVVDTRVEAAAMAANAGVNLNCGYLYKYLPQAVDSGLVSEAVIDEILADLLRTRFKLGLFDPPQSVPYNSISTDVVNSEEHKKLAYQTAAESIVLLKNDNNTLPLDKDKLTKIYVTGPNAFSNEALIGNYNGISGEMVTFLEGITSKVDNGTIVTYSMGCLPNTDSVFHGHWQAGHADATVAVMGLTRLLEGEEGDAMLAEGGDRREIKLPENQIEYIRMLKKNAGDKPLIVVFTGGSAIAFPEIDTLADAVLYAWYPGEQGGNALADIIFGDFNPSGKLPVTIYKSIDDLPAFEDYNMENRTYRYFNGEALYPFGHGLSYSDIIFEYIKLSSVALNEDDELQIKVVVTNNSDRDAQEVIQVYAAKTEAEHFRPTQMLVGFEKVMLPANQSKTVIIPINIKDLQYWDEETQSFKVEKGEYEIRVGSSSDDISIWEWIEVE